MDETHIISLMQSDTGLVEDVKYLHELCADLCSQTNALAFSP